MRTVAPLFFFLVAFATAAPIVVRDYPSAKPSGDAGAYSITGPDSERGAPQVAVSGRAGAC